MPLGIDKRQGLVACGFCTNTRREVLRAGATDEYGSSPYVRVFSGFV